MLGPGDLDRLDRSKDFPYQPGDVPDGFVVGPAITLDTFADQVYQDERDQQGQENNHRDIEANARKDQQRNDKDRGLPNRVGSPGEEVGKLFQVVPKTADRLAGRGGEFTCAGPGQDMVENVFPDKRLGGHLGGALGGYRSQEGQEAAYFGGEKDRNQAPQAEVGGGIVRKQVKKLRPGTSGKT